MIFNTISVFYCKSNACLVRLSVNVVSFALFLLIIIFRGFLPIANILMNVNLRSEIRLPVPFAAEYQIAAWRCLEQGFLMFHTGDDLLSDM
jgi:hypothetical protein